MSSSLPKKFSGYLITQALGAFNDNLYKMLLQLYILQVLHIERAEEMISQATFLFTIPFVIFGPWSGYLADRFSKTFVMRWVKGFEVGIMLLSLWAFYHQSLSILLFILFLLATHSAFFAPAKAGLIPETCSAESITRANSWVELTTFIAILAGSALAGILLTLHQNQAQIVALYCLAVACLGLFSSFFTPYAKPSKTDQSFPINPIKGMFTDLRFLKKQKGLFLAALANSYFWLLGLIFMTNILVYGKKFLGLQADQNTLLSLLPAYMGIGIGLGSMLASRWSGKKVELGLVPLGGMGMASAAILLFFSIHSYLLTALLLFLAGVMGGLYIVPLYAFLQFEAQPGEKGRVLSTAGVMNGFFLVFASLIYRLLSVELQWSSRSLFLFMGILTIAVVIYICTVIPEYFVRFLGWLLTHTVYDIKIKGAEHVPQEGAVLLVPNHVSFVDAMLVGATIQRFIKFVMYKKIYEIPVVRFLCGIMEVIPIAPYEGRESVSKSLETAREKLLAGEVVCIFAEGKITRDGAIDEFRPGFEKIMAGTSFSIIPVYLHNVWGSIFSFENGKVFWKWPKKIPYQITVVYGKPMSSASKAEEVENRVRLLAQEFSQDIS
ncbi:MAG: MFS transporter [Deltaproteobacteria bacterium]|nr:MFS transporter [Deltaproteobacteria bacterium]